MPSFPPYTFLTVGCFVALVLVVCLWNWITDSYWFFRCRKSKHLYHQICWVAKYGNQFPGYKLPGSKSLPKGHDGFPGYFILGECLIKILCLNLRLREYLVFDIKDVEAKLQECRKHHAAYLVRQLALPDMSNGSHEREFGICFENLTYLVRDHGIGGVVAKDAISDAAEHIAMMKARGLLEEFEGVLEVNVESLVDFMAEHKIERCDVSLYDSGRLWSLIDAYRKNEADEVSLPLDLEGVSLVVPVKTEETEISG